MSPVSIGTAASDGSETTTMRGSSTAVRSALLVVAVHALLLALVVPVLLRASATGVPAGELLRDPLVVLEAPLHIGLLSHLGVLTWCAAGGACLLAAAVLLGVGARRREGHLLLGVGALTVVLAVDDLLLVHEGLAPVWLGVPEKAVLAGYGLVALALLVRYRDLVLRLPTRGLLLLGTLALAASVGVDLVAGDDVYRPAEDLLKVVGVWDWSCAWSIAAARLVQDAVVPRDA